MANLAETLQNYIPQTAVPIVVNLLETNHVQLRITKSRTTKLGDYRPPIRVKFHKISVNYDLNQYQFLLTLIHEFAHLKVWEKHQNKVKPHGNEWKQFFRKLMEPLTNETVFPIDLIPVIKAYLANPSATSNNTQLLQAMRNYDKEEVYLTLEDIPVNSLFKIYNGRIFRKGEKLRKRFKCLRLDNKRYYMVSPLIKVERIGED